MISILDKERKRIEGKLVAETFENVISSEKLVYDFSKKTEIIDIEFKSKNYISENTHIIIKDESKNDSEFVCIEENGLKSSLIPAYVKDLNNVFMNSNEELNGQLKSVLSTLLLNTGYNIEYNDLVVDEEITLSKNNKSVFEKLLDIVFEKDLSIRHKYDINTNERTLIINKGKDLRKSNPKEVSGRIPGFEFNVDKSNIKTGLIMYNDNNESITVKDSLNQARFIKDENYIFDTMEVKGKTRDEMEEIASKYLNDSSLNAIDLKMTGLVLRNWTNCHYNKFISSQIFINYKNIKPELTAGFQIYKLERSLFDYNIEKFNFFAKHKDSNEVYKPEMLENYTKYANDNIFIKDNTSSKSNDVKLVESLVNKQLESFKNYINDISNNKNSGTDGSSVLQSNKELNFDAIISDFNLIKSQKDQVVNQLKSIFDSAYLKEDAIKIQVRDKIKEINNDFDKIKSEVNKLNRADQNESLMKDINKSFVGFYSVVNSTKSIIELSNEAINLEMNKLQNEYSHGIKDTVFSEIGRVLGLSYDSKTQKLTGNINVTEDINEVKTSLELMRVKVNRIENDLNDSDRGLKENLIRLTENLSNVLGLPINSESGLIDGAIDNQDTFDLIQKQIQKTKDEIAESKVNLENTKTELEKQQEELDQKSKDIDKAMAEANRVREDLGQELEVSQKEFNYYMDSRGDNLIFNGNADQGDESNFPGMYYDNSDAFQSAASFRIEGFNSIVSSERLIPINPEKTYKLSMFMKNNNSLPSSIGHLSYDKDGQLIESQHVMGSEKPVIELAQELRQGDKVIYFNSLDGLDDTYRFQSAPLDEEDDTPVYDYDRDGSVVLPSDADDILSIDDPNAIPDEEEDTIIYAEDTPEEDKTTEPDVPMPDSDEPVETNSTPVDEEEAIKNMTNNYNVSNAGIVNRNINPNLTDYNDNHSLVIWNFKSNDGYNYGESTYSRNVFMNGWDYGAIDRENNCIYLNRPFDLINYDSEDGGFPAGTKVSGTFTDSNVEWSLIKDEDIPNEDQDDDPEEFNGWYHRQSLITKENIRGTNGFLYGAFYMTLYFKVNQIEDSDVIEFEDGSSEPKFWLTNMEMYDVTGLESVKKTVIDTNELVATMMTKKEMDDYRKQVVEGFSEVSQTVDMIRQEVSKKIEDLDDKVMTDITSRIETIAGQIDLVSESQKVDKEELEKQIGQIKIETDKITSLVQRIDTAEDNYSDLSTKVEQLDSSYTITAEKVEKQGTDITDLSGKLTVANNAITQEVKDRKSAVDDAIESSKALVKVEADRITNLVSKQESTDDTISNLETSITAEIGKIENKVTNETSVEALSNKIKIGGNNLLVGTEKFDLPFNKTSFSRYGGIIKDGIGYSLDYNTESNRLAWSIFQNVDVIPNTDYVLSYNAHNKEGITQGIAYTPIMRLTDDGKIFDSLEYIITSDTYRETKEDIDNRYVVKFNTGKSRKIRIYFTSKDVDSLAYISKPQLELGNIATDWGLSKGDLEDRFNKAETRITQTEEDITLNATKLTETGNLIEKNYSELKVETDKISSIVSEQKILDDKISANTSSIKQLPNQITSQVSAVEKRVNENINNIQIGGRNLLLDSLNKTIFKPNNKGLGIPTKNSDNSWNLTPDSDKSISSYYFIRDSNSNDITSVEMKTNVWYTFSIDLILPKDLKVEIGINSDGISRPEGISSKYDYHNIKANERTRIGFTFKWIDKNIIENIPIIIRLNESNSIGIPIIYDKAKLEYGNKATDWSPAPEDIETRLVASETRITQTEKDISLNASSITTLDNKTTNQYSTLKVETDKISGIVSKQEEMDDKIATNTSSIKQLPNQITSQVSAVEKRVNENINNIQVGGRNLLENSLSWNKGFEDNSNGSYKYLWRIYIDELLNKVDIGDEISISFDLQMERGDVFRIYDSVVDPGMSIGSDTITNVGNKKFKYKYTSKITKTSGDNTRWAIYAYNNNNGDKFSIENIKIEKGNKATDWTPAPEDIETSISTVSSKIDQKADSIELSVNKINNYLNADNTLINSDLRNGWEGWTTVDDETSKNLNYAEEINSGYWIFTNSGDEVAITDKNLTDKDYLTLSANNEGWKQWQLSDVDYSDGNGSPKMSKISAGTYTISMQIRKDEGSTGNFNPYIRINGDSTVDPIKLDIDVDSEIDTDWKEFTVTGNISSSDLKNKYRIRLILVYTTGSVGKVYVRNVRLDKSNYPQNPRFSIAPEEDMTFNIDNNLALGSVYRLNNVSRGTYKRMTLLLNGYLKKNTKYKVAFDYNIQSGKNSEGLISLYPYRYPYKGSGYSTDVDTLPEISSVNRLDYPVSANKRNVIEITTPNEDKINQLLFYGAKAGTTDNSEIVTSFENIVVKESKDVSNDSDMSYNANEVKNVFKYKQNTFGSRWPAITSSYMPVGQDGQFNIGDYVTGSVYIYIPATARKYLSYKIYFEVATYENTSQTGNPKFGVVEIPASEFVFGEWKRYSFTAKIPRTSDNGQTNYLRFLLRYNNYDKADVYNDGTVFYYAIPKLEKGDQLKPWTPSPLDKYSTQSMSSKIAMNSEAIKMISRNIDLNTDKVRIYNDKGNMVFTNDVLRISKTALDTDNFVEINSKGLNIRKNGVDQAVDGKFKGESNVQQTIPMGRSFNPPGPNKLDGLYHVQEIAGAYYLDAEMYSYAAKKKHLTEGGGAYNALLGSFSFYHDKRYLVMSFTYDTSKNANLYVTVAAGVGWKTDSKTALYFDKKYTSESKGIISEYIDLGTPNNYNKTLVIQLGITGTSKEGEGGSITIKRLSLSNFNSPS
ncbi:putative tail fiber protein [Staphylococcus phage vB_StaM_PB50]|nr:putative tail fiber protein [Staphylococcus phage vB_StaM_PB50]